MAKKEKKEYKCGSCPLEQQCYLHRASMEFHCSLHKDIKEELQMRKFVSDSYYKSDSATITDDSETK